MLLLTVHRLHAQVVLVQVPVPVLIHRVNFLILGVPLLFGFTNRPLTGKSTLFLLSPSSELKKQQESCQDYSSEVLDVNIQICDVNKDSDSDDKFDVDDYSKMMVNYL